MTELLPSEQYFISTPAGRTPPAQPAVPILPPEIMLYFEERRRSLITELRAVDKALGRPQTIPERERGR